MTLDVVPEDAQIAHSVLLTMVRQNIEDILEHEGYTIRHLRSETQRSADMLEITTTVMPITTYAWDYRAGVQEMLDDMGVLVTIFNGILPVLRHLFRIYQQVNTTTSRILLRVTVYVDNLPISVETENVEQTAASLRLAQRFRSSHPATRTTAQSSIHITASIAENSDDEGTKA
jgi:hypothetical protein